MNENSIQPKRNYKTCAKKGCENSKCQHNLSGIGYICDDHMRTFISMMSIKHDGKEISDQETGRELRNYMKS